MDMAIAHARAATSNLTVGITDPQPRLPPRARAQRVVPVASLSVCSEPQSTEDEVHDDAEGVVKNLPDRWRMVKKFDTMSPYDYQKVVIDLGMTTSYRKEGANHIIRTEILDILWDSNMFSNEENCRGWFIDEVEIQLQPMWSQDEFVTGALFPKTSNVLAYFGHSTQAGITGIISRNPSIAVFMSNTRSQQTSQQMYKCNWERGPDGLVRLNWKLNLWCPSTGNFRGFSPGVNGGLISLRTAQRPVSQTIPAFTPVQVGQGLRIILEGVGKRRVM